MRHSLLLGWLLLTAACGGSTESELGSSTPAGGSAGSAGSSAGSAGSGVGGGASGSSGQGGASASGAGGATAGQGGSVAAGSGGAGGSTAGAGGSEAGGAGGSVSAGAGGSEVAGAGGSEVAGAGGSVAAGAGGASEGGAAGAGNAAGSAGAADCAPPSDPTRSALCVSFAPEEMDFVADDPQLDGQGVLYLAAYDTPFPDNGPGEQDDAKPLAAGIFPNIQGGPQPTLASVTQLPMQRLDNLPSTVYLRALFFDNLESLEQKNIAWGVWIGGLELSGGLKENLPLNQQALTPGKASSLTLPLNALRRLEVSVKLKNGTKPLDEGSGPFSWFAFHDEILAENTPLFGIGDGGCLKLGGGETSVVRGFVTGPGDHYVVGNLNDFNNPGGFEGGDILNVEGAGGALKAVGAKLNFGPKEYRKTHSIELSLVIPLPPNTQNPAPYICP